MKTKTTKNTRVRDWYINEYPEGSYFMLKEDIEKEMSEATFEEVYLNIGNVYDILNVKESDIRGDVFEKLAELYGVDYDTIYYKWLNSDINSLDKIILCNHKNITIIG